MTAEQSPSVPEVQKLCPFLGKLSAEEAGVMLEFFAMPAGHEAFAPLNTAEKPAEVTPVDEAKPTPLKPVETVIPLKENTPAQTRAAYQAGSLPETIPGETIPNEPIAVEQVATTEPAPTPVLESVTAVPEPEPVRHSLIDHHQPEKEVQILTEVQTEAAVPVISPPTERPSLLNRAVAEAKALLLSKPVAPEIAAVAIQPHSERVKSMPHSPSSPDVEFAPLPLEVQEVTEEVAVATEPIPTDYELAALQVLTDGLGSDSLPIPEEPTPLAEEVFADSLDIPDPKLLSTIDASDEMLLAISEDESAVDPQLAQFSPEVTRESSPEPLPLELAAVVDDIVAELRVVNDEVETSDAWDLAVPLQEIASEPPHLNITEIELVEHCQEQLIAAGLPADELTVKRVVVAVRQQLEAEQLPEDYEASIDEGTHERKQDATLGQIVSDDIADALRHVRFGRWLLQTAFSRQSAQQAAA